MTKFYDKYFEGYEESRVLNKNGKGTHIEHTYVGFYYKQDLPAAAMVTARALYLLLACSAFALFLYSALAETGLNSLFYVAICQGLILLGTIWLVWVMIFYLTAPVSMTIYKYKSTSCQLKKAAKLLAVLFALTAAAEVIGACLDAQIKITDGITQIAALVAAALVMTAIYLLEKGMPYKQESNV